MKSYDELKAEMETIQQQMVEAKSIIVTPSGQACGATVTNVDLSQHLSPATVGEIRAAWLAHHVVAFPNQSLSDDDLERFSQYFGEFGEDPFIAPIPNREHIIAVKRMAQETAPIFAESWHTDWSFQKTPPGCHLLVRHHHSTDRRRHAICQSTFGTTTDAGCFASQAGRQTGHSFCRTGLRQRGFIRQGLTRPRIAAWKFYPPTLPWPPNIIRVIPAIGKLARGRVRGYWLHYRYRSMSDDASLALLMSLHRVQPSPSSIPAIMATGGHVNHVG
jgi:hypothetical protein